MVSMSSRSAQDKDDGAGTEKGKKKSHLLCRETSTVYDDFYTWFVADVTVTKKIVCSFYQWTALIRHAHIFKWH
jgi:hypothetical protein